MVRGGAETGLSYQGKHAGRLRRQLVSYEYGVTGRPDYIVEHDGYPIPVLRKLGRAPEAPYDSHVAQILVHCLLIEAMIRLPPPYGVIRYDDRTFEVVYDPPAFEALVQLLNEIRAEREHGSPPARSHEVKRRCFACRHRKGCEESLT